MSAFIETNSSFFECRTAPVLSTEHAVSKAADADAGTDAIQSLAPVKISSAFDSETGSTTDAHSTAGGDADETGSRFGSDTCESEHEDIDTQVRRSPAIEAWDDLGTRCRHVIANIDADGKGDQPVPINVEKWRKVGVRIAHCFRTMSEEDLDVDNEDGAPALTSVRITHCLRTMVDSDSDADNEAPEINVEKWCRVGRGVALCLRAAVEEASSEELEAELRCDSEARV